MSNYKLEFKLKQHTPLIHFQHEQHGATLRATEVKPKLDKFILTKLGKENWTDINPLEEAYYNKGKEIAKKKGWLIAGQDAALDYKVIIKKIEQNKNEGYVKIIPPAIEMWIISDGVKICISSFNSKLLSLLGKENAPSTLLKSFFCINSFGKRQNKGFGCFYPENMTNEEFEKLSVEDSLIFKGKNKLFVNNNQTLFYKTISKQWSRLKSGMNYNNNYKKSKVFNYLEDNKLRWGKRWIKKYLKTLIDKNKLPYELKYEKEPIDLRDINSWDDATKEEYRFGRALLGLAEHYEFQTEKDWFIYQVIINGDNIERYKSPFTFKIFNKSTYILVEEIPEKIFDKPFKISIIQKKKNGNEFVKVGDVLEINEPIFSPKRSEFNIIEFSENYLPKINYYKL